MSVRIYLRSIPDKPDYMQLTEPLICGDDFIPVGFIFNGASTPRILRGLFPKWKHPIATCRHDWRCEHAKTKEDRLFADKEFKKDVEKTGTTWESFIGYAGVRIGAMFGIGSNF